MRSALRHSSGFVVASALVSSYAVAALAEPPAKLKPWLEPQQWERDTDVPVLSLGEPGTFDDTHIFAPAVTRENNRYLLFYCGSTGNAWDVAPKDQRIRDERVFQMGLATSTDGKKFARAVKNPVFKIGQENRSILTPCILRDSDGTPHRENGKLRMWYASTIFRGDRKHTIHEATSTDGVTWDEPSPPLVNNAYCPSVIKTDDGYQMWYTDVTTGTNTRRTRCCGATRAARGNRTT